MAASESEVACCSQISRAVWSETLRHFAWLSRKSARADVRHEPRSVCAVLVQKALFWAEAVATERSAAAKVIAMEHFIGAISEISLRRLGWDTHSGHRD